MKIIKVNFMISIAWLFYVICLVAVDIGKYTSGPQLITLWDAVWIPCVVVIFPFCLGFLSHK